MELSNNQLEVVKLVRGFFPTTSYLGGSTALELYFDQSFKAADLDFFIYQPRSMERWALEILLHRAFDVLMKGWEYTGVYKIEGQYAYFKCRHLGIEFDLIFIDPERIEDPCKTVGSSLATVQLKIDYSPSGINTKSIPPCYRSIFKFMKGSNAIQVFDGNTPIQLEKVKRRAAQLGYKIHQEY